MKSGSMSSFQSAAELPDRDDEPTPRSMPEKPKPGERFALEHHPNSWTVYDWVQVDDHEEPEEFTRWLSEADARLLVFGGHLLATIVEPIPSGLPGGTFADDLMTLAGIISETKYAAIADRLRDKAKQMHAAIAKAKGS